MKSVVITVVLVFLFIMALEIGVQIFVNYGRKKPKKQKNFLFKKYCSIKKFISKKYLAFKERKKTKMEQ